ncbi:MAG: prepilin peptidase [Deltaproteobacteria bacterium]|nr:prepilin peptidase [Deltaproteobacteria bacterium]
MSELLAIVPAWQILLLAGVFGALWGSFANVVIARWPQGQSVVRPASHCMACGTPIRFYDNIPVISYLVLRGRCRHCKASFSPRYPVVELCMALLSVAVARVTLLAAPDAALVGLGQYFVLFAFVWALVTAGLIDLETFLLPDAITLPGIVVGLLASWFVLGHGWWEPLAAAAGGFLVIYLPFVLGYRMLTGSPGMGEGDAKLVAMIGAFLGVRGAVFALFAGALQGLAVGSIMVVRRRRTGIEPPPPVDDNDLGPDGKELAPDPRFRKAKVPFGPFLALGAIEFLLFGDALMNLYIGAIEGLLGLR